jgi:high-affinity Fe2+/Pb2+ permease
VAVGGAVLVVLGLLLLRPARGHRVSGVLALGVALAVAAAVGARSVDAGWDARVLGPGVWCAAAVAGLGVLGALKAMLTAPRVTTTPAGQVLVS